MRKETMKRAIILMFDSLNRHMLPPYGDTVVNAPNFARLAHKAVTFDNFYAGSMPCIPARRELHSGRYNFLHRSWGPLEPFDDSMPQILKEHGVYTHLVSDHPHYWEDGGATYHERYSTWEFFRGQEGDPWKGDVGAYRASGGPRIKKQDAVNRAYTGVSETAHPQTKTMDAGMEFLEHNVDENDWMVQIEMFDPHEPFFVPEAYQKLYKDKDPNSTEDWPDYAKVIESDEVVRQVRLQYASLVSMCDHSLGRVLDFMDGHDMWDDTMLFVITDHGFLLGEHGWWAKSVQPWFNELVHLPMFLWDPRLKLSGLRRDALAQTIDIAPTLLEYFGLEPTADMQGRDLSEVLSDNRSIHQAALFGVHGGHVNITDGHYVYMRAACNESNQPLEEYTLMPTHMRSRFDVTELRHWEKSEPFTFTKGVSEMKIPAASIWMNPWRYGSLLFNLDEDPHELHPIDEPETELRLLKQMATLMHESDAPRSQFERMGIPYSGPITDKNLLVHSQMVRARQMATPLPREFSTITILNTPLNELEENFATRPIIEKLVPSWTHTELVTVSTNLTLLDAAKMGILPAEALSAVVESLQDDDEK
jgi:arylsulfatase A-like enzyme